MGIVSYLIIFLFGLSVGSFLNCVVYRLAPLEGRARRRASFLRGRSYCPHCKHVLEWQDLIPVLSFMILKGKCRHCQQKISWQYPSVELFTGILFVLIFYISGLGFDLTFGFWILISCFLIIIFLYDLKHFIIPDKVIYPVIMITFLYKLILNSKFSILNSLIAAFGAAIFFLMIVLISRGKWMGIGDVKLAFFMGLFLSFPNVLVALFLAFLIGAIIGVGLILAKRKTLKSEVPFGPFLVMGTFIALFWGERILQWYLDLFII